MAVLGGGSSRGRRLPMMDGRIIGKSANSAGGFLGRIPAGEAGPPGGGPGAPRLGTAQIFWLTGPRVRCTLLLYRD
jgi:hypothetical protein